MSHPSPQAAPTPPAPRPPWGEEVWDLTDGGEVAELLHRAGEANRRQARRVAARVELPAAGRVWVTGDLHDNGPHLQRAVELAGLREDPEHHLVLQEVIHGPSRVNGHDLSIRTLARVAGLKLRYPEQVHQLQSNHELGQRNGETIYKGKADVVQAFSAGLEFLFGEQAEAVQGGMESYIGSLPLAVRCGNGVFCAHSLPTPRKMEGFDELILDRWPTDADLGARGSGRMLVWGRELNPEAAASLAQQWGVEQFVLGHQPADAGYEVQAPNVLILNSDHARGMALPIDLSRHYTQAELIEQLVPLAAS